MLLLETKNLAIGYNKILVKNIELKIRQGLLIALIGVNGIGKTTLLKTLVRLIQPLEGEILWQGEKLNLFSRKILAQKITYTNNFTISKILTVKDFLNLALLPYNNDIQTKIYKQQFNKIVFLFDIKNLLNKKINELSDGQRQMVNLARVFLQDTNIILLDEPFNFLDIEKSLLLFDIFRYFTNEKKTIIFSTHNMRNALKYADILWVIKNNALIIGSPKDLILKGIFENFFRNKNIVFNVKDLDFVLNKQK